LHLGHLRLLEHAKSYPNSYVLVLTDSDRRIKELKGSSRPIHSEYERCSFLFALKSVNRVETFDSDEELDRLIKEFAPDIMVKGSDYRDKHVIGAEHCKRIVYFERLQQYSTTGKIQDIISR
jgi:D-beta-D-heptose 7-phosphate kinase/D-beta-D-heptose 1-phosphate adenosyltransferase